MPELPEVEVVRRGLLPHTVGRTITEVEVLDPRIIRRQVGGADRLRGGLAGRSRPGLGGRGSFLWWRLADEDGAELGEALMGHLGMSGQLRVRTPGPSPEQILPPESEGPAPDPLRHRRLTLHLDDGGAIDRTDQRRFGGIWTSARGPGADASRAGPGSPDGLFPTDAATIGRAVRDPDADRPAPARRLRTRRAAIKTLLLSQDLGSGIGNIYADEALWAARARFDTPGAALSQRRTHTILRETAAVMERALQAGGTSFDELYVNVDGR